MATADTTVLGLFEDIPEAASALNRLRSGGEDGGGRDSRDVQVMSSVPFPEGVLESDRSPIRLPLITFFGALAGIVAGLFISAATQWLYIIRTGGKPIISWPPVGIITYEFMMLFALVACFGGALYEMRLPSWRARVYDPRISEGLIGIAVNCVSDDEVRQAEAFCREAGAVDVRRDSRDF